MISLGANQYGKAEVRIVKVDRPPVGAGGRHVLHDLNVTTQLRGDFAVAFTDGDNSHVHATDTQKNTVYAKARELGIASVEGFLLDLASYWQGQEHVTGTQLKAEEYAWERIAVPGGSGHDHAFVRQGQEARTAVVQTEGDVTWVLSGLTGLVVMKSAGSEFRGFPRDRYTTLPETNDRILATSVTAWWRWTEQPGDWNQAYDGVRATLLGAFAGLHSLALQQTIFEMGRQVLEAFPGIAELRISCPNKHHFLVDLAPFGLDNPGEVFFAADRPYGLIQATVRRDDMPEVPQAWLAVPEFA
jgi:urate oxidase